MSEKLIVEFDDGDSTYHMIRSKSAVSFEEGRHMIRIYDTSGRAKFVGAYHTDNVESIHWDE